MQEEMVAAQEKLKDEKVEASAGGGMVKVVADAASCALESMTIDPDAVDPEDVELLQDMVLAAVNEALRQAEELREKATAARARGGFDPMEALGSLGLGGLGGLGGLRRRPPGGMPGGAPNRAARRKKR